MFLYKYGSILISLGSNKVLLTCIKYYISLKDCEHMFLVMRQKQFIVFKFCDCVGLAQSVACPPLAR